ncbi:MAG: hypothetical protein ACP5KA_05475 [Desulfurococcaceae archaeon]
MWAYKELYSCPLTLVLGKFFYNDIQGLTVLPVANYRASILINARGEQRVVSNIPFKKWLDHALHICKSVASGNINELAPSELAVAYAMMYGGLGTYAIIENSVYVVLLDYVNTAKFRFYLRYSEMPREVSVYDLRDIVLLHVALREGLKGVLAKSLCRGSSLEPGVFCTIETSHGELLLADRDTYVGRGVVRIVPDNSPLRHVIALSEEGRVSHMPGQAPSQER